MKDEIMNKIVKTGKALVINNVSSKEDFLSANNDPADLSWETEMVSSAAKNIAISDEYLCQVVICDVLHNVWWRSQLIGGVFIAQKA